VDADAFRRMLVAVRAASADVVGLTRNPGPVPHLQSFFLVFSAHALASDCVRQIFQRMLALPSKEQVIAVYELQLTERLLRAGLSTVALFPPMSDDPHRANDVFYHWRALLHAGFPYVKTRVVAEFGDDAELRALVAPACHVAAR
jgi:lipopolysaccharide biosynthesis protein